MARSSGFTRTRAIGHFTGIIDARSSAKTVTRPTTSKGSLDTTSETTSTHSEDIWLFDPEETEFEALAGDRLVGSLGGLATDGVDIQPDDRITHGGVTYEVDSVVGQPEDNDADGTSHSATDYFAIQFTRYQ